MSSIISNPAEEGARRAYGNRKPLTKLLNQLSLENKMNLIQEAFLKSLNPSTAIKITNLGKETVSKQITKSIHSTLSYKYKTFLDEENGVIYIGKRV